MSTITLCIFCFLVLAPSCSRLNVDAWSLKNNTDSCYEERGGLTPCSSTIVGNLILMAFYGALLAVAAKFISDGAEMLLDFGFPPSIIGGVVLPILGAVPDAGIIVASGLGDDAQEKLSVGMGTLAGSTVMLLTIAWSASVVVGRCDLDENDEAVDKTCNGPISLTKQGVTLLPDIKSSIALMLVTSLLYFIVQSADWYWGATLVGHQPPYVKKSALATMILCFLGFVAYIVFSLFDSVHNERLAKLHKEELMKRKVIHKMLTLATSRIPKTSTSADKEENVTPVAKKYFKAWHVTTGSKDIKEKLGLLEEDGEDGSSDIEASNVKEQPKEDDGKRNEVIKCVSLLLGGVALVTIFSDPMCNVLTALTNKNNKSYIPIPPFYVSFVVTPFCSNASELVSSLIFASKKTKENITMTFSQLFGAATMNNTLCFGIFMVLVYFKDLEWIYGAEVLCIVIVQVVVGAISMPKTYRLWMGIPVGITYIVCLLIVWVLEYKSGWH